MANNFANLTSPQQLSVFDNVLGSTTSATQGAGAIGLNPALSYATGTVGAALAGVNLGSISGADPTGSAYSDGAFATFLAACAGGKGVIPPGTWKLANSYNVPSGTTLEWMGSNAIIQYWGADAPLVVKSAKEIAFIRPNIDLTNAGSTAKAIPIRGGWFIDFYKPRVTFGNVGQSAWPISSSDVSSMGFGAYVINFFESDLTSGTGGFGISTFRGFQ